MKQTSITTFRFRAASRGRRGFTLPYVLIIVFALMSVAAAFHVSSRALSGRTDGVQDDLRASNLLDAAVSESITAISAGATGNVGKQAQPAYLDGGLFWVESTPLGGELYQLNAVAMAGKGRAAAEVVVERVLQEPLFQAVLNSDEQLTLNSSVVIDSFDSEVGTYASQALNTSSNGHLYAGAKGDVTSNAGIVLNSYATVLGDAMPGVGYAVSTANGSLVSGSTTPSLTVNPFAPIQVPSISSTGNLTVSPSGSSTLPSGKYNMGSLRIEKSATLTVQGPAEIVVADFLGDKDANLMIDATNGPVTFYVTNSYTHISGFEADAVPGSPMAVAFMIAAQQDIVFPSKTMVRGAYYAPDSRITFTSSNEAWGAFGAKRIDMSADMRFHFDESLSKHWDNAGGNGGDPVNVLAWNRDEVAGAIARDRRDPFLLLGVQAAALPSPAAAWDLP